MDIFEWTEETALSPSNLNEMQNIINDNITSEIKNQSKILWTNSSPTSSFASQTITLTESLSSYDCYEIIFRQNTSSARYMTTGKIPVGYGTILEAYGNNYRPTGTTVSGTSIYFENANATDNGYVIPLYVIGHKTGLTF